MNGSERRAAKRIFDALALDLAQQRRLSAGLLSDDEILIGAIRQHASALGSQLEYQLLEADEGPLLVDDLRLLRESGLL